MSSRLIEIFEDEKLVEKIKKRLPSKDGLIIGVRNENEI